MNDESKIDCKSFIGSICTKMAWCDECSGKCCAQCKYGQEMTCTFVCPIAASIMHPPEESIGRIAP